MALNMVLWAVNASECGSHFCEPIAGELKRSEKCLSPALSFQFAELFERGNFNLGFGEAYSALR
jgi:hypothetical protein